MADERNDEGCEWESTAELAHYLESGGLSLGKREIGKGLRKFEAFRNHLGPEMERIPDPDET